MPETSPILALPYIQPAQAQKHVTHNEAVRILDVLVQLVALTRDRTTPPANPAEGDCHLIAAGPTGEWAGRAGMIAVREGGAWQFLAPREGFRAHVRADGVAVTFRDGIWQAQGAVQATQLGVGTTADATNRLAVASPATLLTHAGGGHQLKVNKASPGDTASLVFQTAFSGRAEMGLAGGDNFGVKVSADGSAWFAAISVDAATGRVTLPGTDAGTNANGSYTRLPDGTLICASPAFSGPISTAKGAIFQSAAFVWTYPAAFTAIPQVMPGGSSSASIVGVNAGQATLTQAQGVMWSFASSTTRTFSMVAIGRWF